MIAKPGLAPHGTTLPPEEEPPSQALLPIADQAALVACRRGPDLDAVVTQLLSTGLRPMVIHHLANAPAPAQVPHHVFIDWSLDGAGEYVMQLTQGTSDLWPVVIVDSPSSAALAYASGAAATVAHPLVIDEIANCIQSMRARRERQRMQNNVSEHEKRVFAASAFDGMLRSLGQELRIPLATALANVEYLREVAQSSASPLSDEEHSAILGDTLDAMQQLRSTLESMSVFLPRDPKGLEALRLWRVAQHVLDDLPNGIHLVNLVGDPQVRGWCDWNGLTDVLSILVKRAIQRQDAAEGIRVTVHVYAHDTEARVTVREIAPRTRRPRTSDDPFRTTHRGSGTAQSGLQLAAARHAIVKMGGTLNYIPQNESGCAFRVCLRLAQPELLG